MAAVILDDKKKEGSLFKQSRFLKQWRKRWFVLNGHILYSFRDKNNLASPTESIDLKVFSSVKSSEDYTNKQFSFDVYSNEQCFSMQAPSETEKEDWIRAIGRAIVLSHAKDSENQEEQEEDDTDDDSSSLDEVPPRT